MSALDSPRPGIGNLSDVPEESSSSNTAFSGASTPGTAGASSSRQGSYHTPSLSSSHPTFKPQRSSSSLTSLASASATVPPSPTISRPTAPKTPSNLRVASAASLKGDKDRSDTGSVTGVSVSGVMATSAPMSSKGKGRSKSPGSATIREKDASTNGKDGQGGVSKPSKTPSNGPRYRYNPHLPIGNADAVPATLMYWSKAPVYGVLPHHGLRAHSVTLVDGMAWIFGGCDEKGCWKDVWCFNTGMCAVNASSRRV